MHSDLMIILKRFQDEFDIYWKDTIEELGVSQAQLTSGSRLRPQLALLGYLATIEHESWEKDDFSFISNVAVSIELIHKASLLLDDWVDGDVQRHGLPAFHTMSTPERTVLLAMKMVGLSTYRLQGAFDKGIVLPEHYCLCLNTLIKTIYAMASGAYRELTLCGSDIYNFEMVREIAKLETSEIIGNSLLLGYYSGVGDSRLPIIEKQFRKIGERCGYIFQAMNDLEVFSKPEKLIAHKGNLNYDLSVNRKNLAISLLYQVSSKSDRAKLERASVTELIEMSKKYRIVEYYRCELEKEYIFLLESTSLLSTMGLSTEWCGIFDDFLSIVKRTAEARL